MVEGYHGLPAQRWRVHPDDRRGQRGEGYVRDGEGRGVCAQFHRRTDVPHAAATASRKLRCPPRALWRRCWPVFYRPGDRTTPVPSPLLRVAAEATI